MWKKVVYLLVPVVVCLMEMTSVTAAADDTILAGRSSVSGLIDDLDASVCGGVFYDENGVLHILVTDQEALMKSRTLQNAVLNQGMEIVIEEAEYSLIDLEHARKRLLDHQEKLLISAVGWYESENALSVYTSDVSDTNKAAIASVAGVKNIRYKKSSGMVRLTSKSVDPEVDPVQPYANEQILELYSLDYVSRTYQQITKAEDIEEVVTRLKGYQPASSVPHDARQTGFLVFTDRGKYAVCLPSNAKDRETRELYILSQKLNREYPRHIQWFAYMSTDQIESIAFRAFGGKGYTTRKDIRETYDIDALITDRESIEKVSSFLKGMVVNPKEQVHRRPYPNPGAVADEYSLDIHFKNGIIYRCYGPFLSITSSDMDEMISYSESYSSNQIDALRDLMMELPESRLKLMEHFCDG